MPEHVHLLISADDRRQQDTAKPRFDHLLKSIKRLTSVYVKRQLVAEQNKLVAELTIQERPGVRSFRFWQQGPRYDRNLLTAEAVLAALTYIHNNPVSRGLCQDPTSYKWSSAMFYATDGPQSLAEAPALNPLPTELWDGHRST